MCEGRDLLVRVVLGRYGWFRVKGEKSGDKCFNFWFKVMENF